MCYSSFMRIALLIESNREFGRSLLRGITAYSRIHGPWGFYREADFYQKYPLKQRVQRMLDWKPDGIILRENPESDAEILALPIPKIYSPHIKTPDYTIPSLIGDDRKIGAMAAEHLLERGFKHYAFCGFDAMWWAIDRGRYFAERLTEEGFETQFYHPPQIPQLRRWEEEPTYMAAWLKSLPKPVAVMACTDDLSQQLIEACKIGGIHIPEEVAILGVDNDEMTCTVSSPQLSSVQLNGEQVGFQAAEMLHRLIKGETPKSLTIPILPTHVVTRQSTDIIAVTDPSLSKALRFIREHFRENIRVPDIAAAAHLSRRALELKFRREMQCSIHEEIMRLRISYAKELLVDTNLSVAQISENLGYEELKYFSRSFKSATGSTPSGFRKQFVFQQG